MQQLKHKFWRSDLTLRDSDGRWIDQKNVWDIDSPVRYADEYQSILPNQYHEKSVAFYFQLYAENSIKEVDSQQYWATGIGDWIDD